MFLLVSSLPLTIFPSFVLLVLLVNLTSFSQISLTLISCFMYCSYSLLSTHANMKISNELTQTLFFTLVLIKANIY